MDRQPRRWALRVPPRASCLGQWGNRSWTVGRCGSSVELVKDFYPIAYLPRGVRLTAYSGEAADLPAGVLQDFLDAVAAGHATVPIDHVYEFDQIVEAHTAMESGGTRGKLVVAT
jgi:NADPH:quinone reductase-like Zn-dependent oxidoreductase